MSDHDHGPVQAPTPHILPLKLYWGVFLTLCFLTVVTVAVAQVNLGPFNLPVAILVATVKATLVAGIFMHLAWDHKQNLAVFVASLLFMGIFIVLTMTDTESRDFVDDTKRNFSIRDEKVEEYNEKYANDPNYEQLRPMLGNPMTDEKVRDSLKDPNEH